jgi:hypothetical protein
MKENLLTGRMLQRCPPGSAILSGTPRCLQAGYELVCPKVEITPSSRLIF